MATTRSRSEVDDLRALVAAFVDVYGYIGVPRDLMDLARSCREEAVANHIDTEISKALG